MNKIEILTCHCKEVQIELKLILAIISIYKYLLYNDYMESIINNKFKLISLLLVILFFLSSLFLVSGYLAADDGVENPKTEENQEYKKDKDCDKMKNKDVSL